MLKVGEAVGVRAQKPPLDHGLCFPMREEKITLGLLLCPQPQTRPQEGVLILSLDTQRNGSAREVKGGEGHA